jgi:hypothetical protein
MTQSRVNENNVDAQPQQETVALWCLINKNHVLVQKTQSAYLDRAVWHLPRILAPRDALILRREVDALLASFGLDSVRRAMINLGSVYSGGASHGEPVRLLALGLDEPALGKIASGLAFFPLSQQRQGTEDASSESLFPIVDALVWTGAQIYFSLPESRGRPKDYEIFASLALHMLKDEYINLWFPEASRDLGHAGINVSIEIIDQQPTLKLTGRQAMLEEDIFLVRSRLLDLARHCKGRFWVTEILDGEETVLDFAEPKLIGILNLGALS